SSEVPFYSYVCDDSIVFRETVIDLFNRISNEDNKNYLPIFDFYISERYQFLEAKFQRELNELWPQGASALLFIYIFLRWISTRYRPFIWLMLFVGAFNLYGIGLNRYVVDWVFPYNPRFGLLTIQCFLYFALIGLYMLLLDSWNLKDRDEKLYRWGKIFVYCFPLISLIIFLLNYYTFNYQLTARISTSFLLVLFVYSSILLLKVWKKLDRHELLLAYGLICFLMTIIISTAGIYGWDEDYYIALPSITKAVSVCIAFLFLMGLNGRLRQYEDDNTHYLKELNLLQKHQNELLEENVKERTKELSQRNAHIETLMNAEPTDLAIYKAEVDAAMLRIFEACSFQDLTGQRVNKVIATLRHIEERVGQFAGALGVTDTAQPETAAEQRAKALILNGPALNGPSTTQDDIDAMFA
ncbi:MAG: hypothetical protein EOP04_21960, partial [Proteobacteria bacterium]